MHRDQEAETMRTGLQAAIDSGRKSPPTEDTIEDIITRRREAI